MGPGGVAAEQRLSLRWVEPPVAPGIAAQQAPAGEDDAPQYAVALDHLHRVGRAGRVVLAARAQQRRDEPAVGLDRQDEDPPHDDCTWSTSSASEARTPFMPSFSASSRASGRATTT